MGEAEEYREELMRWHERMAAASRNLSAEDERELRGWGQKNADGQNVKTADWPGWEKLIGKKPVAGAEARALFRGERLRMIAAAETPVELDHVPRVVIHMLPHKKHQLDLSAGVDMSLVSIKLMPMVSQHMPQNEYGIDADAERIVSYTSGVKGFPSYAYSRLFADGAIEIVRASYYVKEHRLIADEYEDDVVNAVQRGLVLQESLGVEAPVSVMLSLLGVAGCQIGDRNLFPRRRPIKEDELRMREVLFSSHRPRSASDVAALLRTSFDTVWRAAGLPRSYNYDAEGNWLRG